MLGLSGGVAIACVLTVYVGATVQASIGIGLGMIASPVLAFADPDFIPAAIMLAVLPLTFTVAWVDRDHVERRQVGFALMGSDPGLDRRGARRGRALRSCVRGDGGAASVFVAVGRR